MQNRKWIRLLTQALCGSFVFGLAACNSSDPDNTPPTYTINQPKTQSLYRFGVTDTIEVVFSEKIDTTSLALDFTPPEGIGYRFIAGTKLQIFGKNKTYSTGHFNINSPFTAVLSGLRDAHGNGQSRIEASFSPYAWVDLDRIDSTFNGIDSLFRSPATWIDGSAVTDSLISEGALDFKKLAGQLDYSDLKVVSLTGGDTLYIGLKTRKDLDLNLKIAGPYSQTGLDSVLASNNGLDAPLFNLQTSSKGIAEAKIPADMAQYRRKFNDPGAQGLFLIFIGIPQFKEGFYRLGTRIHVFK